MRSETRQSGTYSNACQQALVANEYVESRRLGRIAFFGALSMVFVTMSLMLTSFVIGNVLVKPGYERIAFAKPAAQTRVVRRQLEVAHFGNKVSDAFGIHDSVAHEFADWILEASERQQIPPELLASLVVTESSFRKGVRSHVGAIGPAQVRPEFWGKFCGNQDLTDPAENVYCGAQVLSYYFDRCGGDRVCALSAYNVGPYAKREHAAKRYVNKIDGYLSSLHDTAL